MEVNKEVNKNRKFTSIKKETEYNRYFRDLKTAMKLNDSKILITIFELGGCTVSRGEVEGFSRKKDDKNLSKFREMDKKHFKAFCMGVRIYHQENTDQPE